MTTTAPTGKDAEVLDTLLWSIVDGQAGPMSRRRAERLIGSRHGYDLALKDRMALDVALHEWGKGVVTTEVLQGATAQATPASWLAEYPVQWLIGPAAVLGLAITAAACRFGLPGLYAIVASLVERLP